LLGGGGGLSSLVGLVPSSQFVEEHLAGAMNFSSPCAFAGVVPRLVPAPLAVPVT
jgi:hypothetical protein